MNKTARPEMSITLDVRWQRGPSRVDAVRRFHLDFHFFSVSVYPRLFLRVRVRYLAASFKSFRRELPFRCPIEVAAVLLKIRLARLAAQSLQFYFAP